MRYAVRCFTYRWNQEALAEQFFTRKWLVSRVVRNVSVEIGRVFAFSRQFSPFLMSSRGKIAEAGRGADCIRACFENISGGLAAGRGDWLRCFSVTDFCEYAPSSRLAIRPVPPQSLADLFSKQALRECLILFTSGVYEPDERSVSPGVARYRSVEKRP